MFLSRLELRPDAARLPAFWADLEDVYRAHQAIWRLFGDDPERKRDFLFRKEGEGAGARWFTLSAREPLDSRGIWRIESKPFAPQLRSGDCLRFSVRVNPTVAKSPAGVVGPLREKGEARRSARKSSVRHDVVMNAKRAGHSGGDEDLVTTVCRGWLESRAARLGFRPEPQINVDGYRQVGAAAGKKVRLSVVDLNGVLTVTDPETFLGMLRNGLGPAKAFGCGLMLLRRA